MISNPEEAKKELVRLGFPPVFLEIADGVIPTHLYIQNVRLFYKFLPSLLESFPEAANYLPLWEVNGEGVIAFDRVRNGFFEFYFEDGNQDRKIADTYEKFIADLMMKVSEIGCSNQEIEKLAALFENPRLGELQAFFKKVENNQNISDLYDFLCEVDEKQGFNSFFE